MLAKHILLRKFYAFEFFFNFQIICYGYYIVHHHDVYPIEHSPRFHCIYQLYATFDPLNLISFDLEWFDEEFLELMNI